MTLLKPQPVPYRNGPEHRLPFPPLLTANFADYFIASPALPRKAFDVFQQKLKELGLDQFPYRLPAYTRAVKGHRKKQDKSAADELKAKMEALDDKEIIMSWKDSPWYKECKWSDDYDQLQYKLLKAKKPLRMQTIYQQFETLNLCNEEITEISSDTMVLKSLKVLALADNRLRSLNMETLPRGLKHLELYGNLITALIGFCPPYMRHLGLAANGIVSPFSVFAPADLRPLVSIDLGENLISNIDECADCLGQFPQLDNLRAAGNPISLIRSYRAQLVLAVKPRLLCMDGDEVTEADRANFRAITYDTFTSPLIAAKQCILLFTIDDITGAPEPAGYKAPADQTAYPLTKWAYTVEISFPGCLLPTKPALPPPTAAGLKAEEKAKKAKAAKIGKKGHSKTPTPPVPEPEPEDPFYAGFDSGIIKKVTNDGYDWIWADPLVVASPVPLLTAGEKPMPLLYEYLRRGMKVRVFQKRVMYAPAVTGKKSTAKAKLPKGQKPDLWAVPLTPEVADSIEITSCTIPSIALLHGDPEVKFKIVVTTPPSIPAPTTPGLGKKKIHVPGPGAKEVKSRLGAHSKMAEEPPKEKVPMVINMRVKIHHDQTPADLLTYPPEIPPWTPPPPEIKPLDAHSHTSPSPKSASPRG